MASDSQRMSKEEKRQARIERQNERLAKYQEKQQAKQPRARKKILPESWGKYVVPAVLIIWLILTFSGSVSIRYNDESFDVKAFVKTANVAYENITSVEYYSAAESGTLDQGRMQGFLGLDTLRLKAGTYDGGDLSSMEKYAGFGNYQLYADSRYKGDYVLFTVWDTVYEVDTLYAIGAKTIDVQELYDTIVEKTGL